MSCKTFKLSSLLSRNFWVTLRPNGGKHDELCKEIETALWKFDNHRGTTARPVPWGYTPWERLGVAPL